MPRSFRLLPAKTPDRPGGRVSVPVAAPAGCGAGAARVAVVGRETERAR